MNLPLKLGMGSAAIAIIGSIFGFLIFPMIIRTQLSKEKTLKNGTELRAMWTRLPFPLEFKIFVFNCTNHHEVMNGAKPIVQEIGPYHYEEWKEKVNLEDIESEDAISYNRKDTFIFNREKSGPGLTGDEIVTVPDMVLVSTAIITQLEKPAFQTLVSKAFAGLYGNTSTIFYTGKVKDFLFEGVPLDCNRTDFAPAALCSALLEYKNIDHLGQGKLSFSLLGQRNNTVQPVVYTVLRGIKNVMDVGKLVKYNGSETQRRWWGAACNAFRGTDGTVFPPFFTEKDPIVLYSTYVCRSMEAWYERKSSYQGIPTSRYISYVGDLAEDPSTQCFCETPAACPPKGLMSIRGCVNPPILVSNPHLLHADPSVQQQVSGLSPNVENHQTLVDLEPITGTPLLVRNRIQFNIPLYKIEKITLFKNLTSSLLPFIWVEEGFALNETYTKQLKKQLFIPVKIVSILKWFVVLGGVAGVGISVFLHLKPILFKTDGKTSPTSRTAQLSSQTNGQCNGQSNDITLEDMDKTVTNLPDNSKL